jgi:hypothetical protein
MMGYYKFNENQVLAIPKDHEPSPKVITYENPNLKNRLATALASKQVRSSTLSVYNVNMVSRCPKFKL